jgi:hypothetical protein
MSRKTGKNAKKMPKKFPAGYTTKPRSYVLFGEVQMLMNPLSRTHPVYLLLNDLQRLFF